jgi:hypothetical protein
MLRDDSTCMDSQKKHIHYVYEDESQNNYIYIHALCSGTAHGFSKSTSKGREQEKDIDG